MKKIIVFALIFVLALTLAACGGNSTTPPGESAPPSGSDGNSDGQAMASLIGWMMDGAFSYDFTMTSEGPDVKTESSGSMAIDKENMALTTETTIDGQTMKSRIIIKDGVTYIVDDANKLIMKAPGNINPTAGIMTDFSTITKTSDGVGEINGKTLPYEEYTESDTGATVRFYLDGGEVYGFDSEAEGYKTVMVITNAKNNAPANAFDLPEGYTQM